MPPVRGTFGPATSGWGCAARWLPDPAAFERANDIKTLASYTLAKG